jgi:hypothetical protein
VLSRESRLTAGILLVVLPSVMGVGLIRSARRMA